MPLPIIHVIGDSHSRLFNNVPGCKVRHIGPRTMYGLRHGVPSGNSRIPLDMRNFGVKPNEYVVYVFGEIDVRTHIGRIRDRIISQHPENNNLLDEILDDLVDNYIHLILDNQQQSQCLSVVAAIVPPSDLIENPDFPFYGPIGDRVLIQQQLNTKLKDVCHQHNILYLDYISKYTNTDGTLNYEMSDGHVHLHPEQDFVAGEELFRLILRKGRV